MLVLLSAIMLNKEEEEEEDGRNWKDKIGKRVTCLLNQNSCKLTSSANKERRWIAIGCCAHSGRRSRFPHSQRRLLLLYHRVPECGQRNGLWGERSEQRTTQGGS